MVWQGKFNWFLYSNVPFKGFFVFCKSTVYFALKIEPMITNYFVTGLDILECKIETEILDVYYFLQELFSKKGKGI